MLRTTISLMQAVALIKDIVARFPDDQRGDSDGTGACVYVGTEDGSYVNVRQRLIPVCIVGQLFADLGILRAMMKNENGEQFGAITGDAHDIFSNASAMGVDFSQSAQDFLSDVQSAQDGSAVWPVALETGLISTLERLANSIDE